MKAENVISKCMYTAALACLCYAGYSLYESNNSERYKSVTDLKNEIKIKNPDLYDSLMHDNVSRFSYSQWLYEVEKMDAQLRADSIAQRAYFKGAQMVRDSIQNAK